MGFIKSGCIGILFFCICLNASAQKTTVTYAQREGEMALQMDIYHPATKSSAPNPVVLFVFGGGFVSGKRDARSYQPYFHYLTEQGYVVASIDYRLGLKGLKKPPSIFNRKPLINAIAMAVEDLYSATNYLLQQAAALEIDTAKIIVSGSSAGAITALQAEYEKRNGKKSALLLPTQFQYAGIIAFAGAIYSKEAKPDFRTAPAPMLFFHGDEDDFVPYKKIGLFGIGMYGPKSITPKLKQKGHPYLFYTMEGIRHDVAAFPMREFLPEIGAFIQKYVIEKRPLMVDINIKDNNRKNSRLRFSDLYNRGN